MHIEQTRAMAYLSQAVSLTKHDSWLANKKHLWSHLVNPWN